MSIIYIESIKVQKESNPIGKVLTLEDINNLSKPYNPYIDELIEDDENITYNIDANDKIIYKYKQEIIENCDIIDRPLIQPPVGWKKVFQTSYYELIDAQKSINKHDLNNIVPLKENIFKVFYLCPLRKIKVVILGQDPYHQLLENGLPKAQGLSFSISKNDSIIPNSLQNIYKELKREYADNFNMPLHGDLTKWVEQGVFLLNTSLTTDVDKANAHKGYWLGFVTKVLNAIANQNKNVIFVLWGNDAVKACKCIGQRAIRIITSHPSGLSANRAFKEGPAFIGSDCFKNINNKLKELSLKEIEWNL